MAPMKRLWTGYQRPYNGISMVSPEDVARSTDAADQMGGVDRGQLRLEEDYWSECEMHPAQV